MKPYIKRHLKRYIAASLGVMLVLQTNAAYAAVYFEQRTQETIANGIFYEDRVQATSAGLIDVSVLYVSLENPDVEVKPLLAASGYGAKESVSQMALESGAMAGVNADFFEMSMNPATPFGDVVIDDEIISIDKDRPGFATFFLDENNKPFVEYIDAEPKFLNNGQLNIKVHAVNKYLPDFSAVYFDTKAITNTAALDAKFPDLVKFVVENNKITYISKGGETVNVPANGYIILCAATYAQYFYESVKVGDSAEFKVEARFDYDKMKAAIGGAGKILENGAYSNYGYVVSPTGRNPRTALGISQDGKYLILAVVDGRGYSVGATHEEMAEIMKNLGAWNAMHFDGGGSSTLVADTVYSKALEVKNNPSDGSQRKVVNGLGVFHNAPVGEAVSMIVTVSEEKVFFGQPITVNAIALDANNKKTTFPEGSVKLHSDSGGKWEGNKFYPEKYGAVVVYAEYNNLIEKAVVYNMDLAQIVPSQANIKVVSGDTVKLSFEGISTDGSSAKLNDIALEVVPAELGSITADGVFTAGASAVTQGYIKCSAMGVNAYIEVIVGTKTEWLNNFNKKDIELEFIGLPTTLKGSADYDDSVNKAGNFALKLAYQFEKSTSTQAAYARLKSPIMFDTDLYAFEIAVHGHGSGGWVRAKLMDAAGHEHTVDIVKDINFTGWGNFTVKIPDDAVQPVSIDRLYVAALTNEDTKAKAIYFDEIRAQYAADGGDIEVPASDRFNNPYEMALSADKQKSHIDLTFVGDIIIHKEDDRPENYIQLQEKAMKKFTQTADASYFVGPADMESVEGIKRGDGYKFTQTGNYALIEMSGKRGSLSATYAGNWNFFNEAKNSTASHIIIMTDRNPENYSTQKESEMFRLALSELRKAGKNVFVISTSGFNTTSKVIDGVNYINLGALFNMNSSVNKDFRVLRIRINGGNIAYELQQ